MVLYYESGIVSDRLGDAGETGAHPVALTNWQDSTKDCSKRCFNFAGHFL